MKHAFTTLLLICGLFSSNAKAQQAEAVIDPFRWKAKLYEVKLFKEEKTTLIKLRKADLLVESLGLLHYTSIQGEFKEKIIQATLNAKPIPVYDDGTFNIRFGFAGETQTFIITAVDEKNKIHRVQYKIVPIEISEKVIAKITPQRWRFSAGVGLTRLSYRQAGIQPFDENLVTVKGSAAFKIVPDKWDLGISAFFNAYALSTTSVPNAVDPQPYKVQYLGINGRMGYNLIGAPSNFRLNINAGMYFNTAFSNNPNIGFQNMYGPQLYPEMIYIFENGNSLLMYGKFSPALSKELRFSLSNNREVAIGMHYSFPYSETQRMSVGFDMSQLALEAPDKVNPEVMNWASTNTYSLSVGLSF